MSWWSRRRPMRCDDFVEVITAYLDGALSSDEVARIDRHLEGCGGCTRALAQWREVIRLTGHLAERDVDDLDPASRTQLMVAFADARGGDGA
jgi:anti-sigma factor RsiW